jgi:hypothetical protein
LRFAERSYRGYSVLMLEPRLADDGVAQEARQADDTRRAQKRPEAQPWSARRAHGALWRSRRRLADS